MTSAAAHMLHNLAHIELNAVVRVACACKSVCLLLGRGVSKAGVRPRQGCVWYELAVVHPMQGCVWNLQAVLRSNMESC